MWDRGLEFSLLLLILSVHVGTHSCSLLVPRESSAVLEVNREAIHPQFFKMCLLFERNSYISYHFDADFSTAYFLRPK